MRHYRLNHWLSDVEAFDTLVIVSFGALACLVILGLGHLVELW